MPSNNKMYRVTADDGMGGKPLELVLLRPKLSLMISSTFAAGVRASQEIEGEPTDGIDGCVTDDLPEALLVTPKPLG